jgi:S1-C subfamily serine protease
MSRFWQHFVSNGQKQSGLLYLGLQGYSVRLDRALWASCQAQDGVLVRMVQPGSLAEDVGILEGDIILSLGDQPVATCDELFGLIEAMPMEVPLPVILVRHGRRYERLLVVPGPSPKVKKR